MVTICRPLPEYLKTEIALALQTEAYAPNEVFMLHHIVACASISFIQNQVCRLGNLLYPLKLHGSSDVRYAMLVVLVVLMLAYIGRWTAWLASLPNINKLNCQVMQWHPVRSSLN